MGFFKTDDDNTFDDKVLQAAEELIMSQFHDKHFAFGGYAPPPAGKAAGLAIEQAMTSERVQDKIDSFLESKALNEIVHRHMEVSVKKALNEELIKRIVKEIKEFQLNGTGTLG